MACASETIPVRDRVVEETVVALMGLLLASAGGDAALQSVSALTEISHLACRYGTPAAGDRDARDVKEMCTLLIKQLIFGKGKDRDPNIIGDDRYSLFPYDHPPRARRTHDGFSGKHGAQYCIRTAAGHK